MVRRDPPKHRNTPVARERDQAALIRLALLLVSGLALAGGFVYAGRQHFAALRYGYETENLRRVRDELADEQRRFLFEREAVTSPARLERAARRLGLQPMQPAQIDPLGRSAKSAPVNTPSAQSQSSRSQTSDARTKPMQSPKAEMNRNKPI